MVSRPVIEVEGLVKVYGGRRGTRALNGVSFTVPKGDIFGFLGPNGAGKTTTIRILATVLAPTAGTIRIGGHDLQRTPMEVKERIGVMPDEVSFYPTLTGIAHLEYYASFYKIPRKDARQRARELLVQVGIGDVADKKVKTYSHGMKKRLALAQALLHDPDCLIMDEPASGLDPQGMRYFRDLIRHLNGKGKTIFLSSHLLFEVEQLCEHVGIIDHGRMVAADSISNLSSRLSADAPTVLHVTADGVTDEAVVTVSTLPGVANAVRTSAGLDVTLVAGADVSSDVSKALVLAGARLKELRASERSLEDLFLALTKGAPP
jgi:ABC-2 type transport system ATP-binding protein